jgi:hypothetical protein
MAFCRVSHQNGHTAPYSPLNRFPSRSPMARRPLACTGLYGRSSAMPAATIRHPFYVVRTRSCLTVPRGCARPGACLRLPGSAHTRRG